MTTIKKERKELKTKSDAWNFGKNVSIDYKYSIEFSSDNGKSWYVKSVHKTYESALKKLKSITNKIQINVGKDRIFQIGEII